MPFSLVVFMIFPGTRVISTPDIGVSAESLSTTKTDIVPISDSVDSPLHQIRKNKNKTKRNK